MPRLTTLEKTRLDYERICEIGIRTFYSLAQLSVMLRIENRSCKRLLKSLNVPIHFLTNGSGCMIFLCDLKKHAPPLYQSLLLALNAVAKAHSVTLTIKS